METGKTSRYLKYAIGEIILVVIGILIAVSINNWNESRKRALLEVTLLKQLKSEILDIYGDVYSDFNLLDLGNQSHFNILDYIDNNEAYNETMCFDFAMIKQDEYIYPTNAAYSRIKDEGLDIITNDSIRYLTQNLYENIFPRLNKTSNFNPDISETFNNYYLKHFKANIDYSLKYSHTFENDTLSRRIYNESYNYPYQITRNGRKQNQTVGFTPLDFEALKKDDKFRILLGQTERYRSYKITRYQSAKNIIQNLIHLIDQELNK